MINTAIEKRQDCNLKLAMLIVDAALAYPEWRFHQILQNIAISSRNGEDQFYEESLKTLDRVIGYNHISKESLESLTKVIEKLVDSEQDTDIK